MRPVGYLPDYVTVSGYAVVPVVGFVTPGFAPRPDPTEVAEIFEVPLDFILDPANHRIETRRVRELDVSYYVLPYRSGRHEYRIWGATAAMLVDFARRVAEYARLAST